MAKPRTVTTTNTDGVGTRPALPPKPKDGK